MCREGDALDPVIAKLTRGQPDRHVAGFEAGERRRRCMTLDTTPAGRTGELSSVRVRLVP